jgi:hypothetical protein
MKLFTTSVVSFDSLYIEGNQIRLSNIFSKLDQQNFRWKNSDLSSNWVSSHHFNIIFLEM